MHTHEREWEGVGKGVRVRDDSVSGERREEGKGTTTGETIDFYAIDLMFE